MLKFSPILIFYMGAVKSKGTGRLYNSDPNALVISGKQTTLAAGDQVVSYYRDVCGEGDWKETKDICMKNGTFDSDHTDIPTAGLLVWREPHKASRCGDYGRKYQCHYGNYKALELARIRKDDDLVCPHFGSVKAASAESVTPGSYDWEHNVLCKYDIDALAGDCEAATQWTLARRNELAAGVVVDTNWFHFGLMQKLCGQESPDGKNCPMTSAKYVDTNGKVVCSNLNACGLCRDWATKNQQGIDESSRLIREYCGRQKFDPQHFNDPLKTDPSCRCFHIRDKPGLPSQNVPVGCWYTNCQDNGLTNNLVPVDDRLKDPSVCPSFCAQIIDISNAEVIDIGDINMSLSCGDQPTPSPGGNWWKKLTPNQRRIIEITGCGIAVVLGLVIIFKKPSPTKQ